MMQVISSDAAGYIINKYLFVYVIPKNDILCAVTAITEAIHKNITNVIKLIFLILVNVFFDIFLMLIFFNDIKEFFKYAKKSITNFLSLKSHKTGSDIIKSVISMELSTGNQNIIVDFVKGKISSRMYLIHRSY